MQKIRIENWSMGSNATPYMAPEQVCFRLCGQAYFHPRFRDGKVITTSAIIGKRNGLVATRSGSFYELGEPSPDYEKEFPGARQRVLDRLSEI